MAGLRKPANAGSCDREWPWLLLPECDASAKRPTQAALTGFGRSRSLAGPRFEGFVDGSTNHPKALSPSSKNTPKQIMRRIANVILVICRRLRKHIKDVTLAQEHSAKVVAVSYEIAILDLQQNSN